MTELPKADPKLDLVLDRNIDVPPELVWAAWTMPEHLKEWFCPRPWRVVNCEIDLKPGGIFKTEMRGPEGGESNHVGCYLEVVPQKRLVWTMNLLPGYRPARLSDFPTFTAFLTLMPHGSGTRYVATVCHRDESGRASHEAMGFHQGWGTCLDQLVEYAKSSMKK